MELTRIQRKAVDEILEYYNENLLVKVDFKAPTGSGKTFMASWVISSLMERYIESKFVFVIATPSSSSLPYFFEQKLNVYKKDLPYSKFEVEYIESPSSLKSDKTEGTPRIKSEPSKVYIFGKSTFGKGRIFTERNIIDDFVEETKNLGYKLIYIRDEAHIGDLKADDFETKKFENLMQSNADFIIKMTATPNLKDATVKFVHIKETEVNDGKSNDGKWLLKTNPKLLLNESLDEDDLLENALIEFKKIKKSYKTLEQSGIIINPAMLIQVSNEPSNKEGKQAFLNALSKIKKRIQFHNLSWVQYFGDNDKDSNTLYKDKFTLDDITQIDNPVDVVIFKVGPSTGWDIPRACMLLQLRKVCSDKLNLQTIGRIKRNPYPNLDFDEVTNNYYIYSNTPKLDDDFTYYNYQIKKQLIGEEFPVIEIINKRDFKLSSQKVNIQREVYDFIKSNRNMLIQELKMFFVEDKGVDIFRKELYEANGSMVYSSVRNVFIFLKDLKRLIDSRSTLYGYCFEAIKKSYENLFKDTDIYAGVKIKKEHLQFILFHKHTKELMEIVRKNSPFTSKYKINMVPYEPKEYIEVYDRVIGKEKIEATDNSYLFNIVENNKHKNIQPLDSPNSEPVVFRFLSKEINAINDYVGDKVKIWAKNLRTSNISGDYLDKTNTFKRSFFDFIVKFSNGIYWYIEVKGINDIDPEKTEQLKEAYQDYFDKKVNDLFINPIVISVFKVDKDKIYVESTYYEKELINEELSGLGVKELFKKLALIEM